MFYFWLFLGFLMTFTNAYAQNTSKLACATSTDTHLIDTQYLLVQKPDGNFRLNVRYAPGATPIESDPTTTVRLRDVKNLPQRAQLFEKLPQDFSIDFPSQQCTFRTERGQINWHCFLNAPNSLGQLNYKSLSFFVYSQKVESAYGVSQWYNVGLEFRVTPKDAMGEARFEELMRVGTADQRRELINRQNHETLLRSSIVTFENSDEGLPSCYVPEHTRILTN